MRRIASAAAAKKWPRLFQLLAAVRIDQPEVRLVDQGRGLERLAGLLAGQLPRGQLAQLVVDQRQELSGGLRVALLDRREDVSDVVHWRLSRQATSIPPHLGPEARRSARPARNDVIPADRLSAPP